MKEDYRVIDATFAVAKRKPGLRLVRDSKPVSQRSGFQAFFSQLQKFHIIKNYIN